MRVLHSAAVRALRAAVTAALVVTSAIVLTASPAAALPADVYLACGYGQTVGAPSNGDTCQSLPDAVAAALAANTHGERVTVDLLPGVYCPLDIPYGYANLLLQGVGLAGVDTTGGPITYSGPEAALSTFRYSSAHCSASAPAYMVQASAGYSGTGELRFANLAIDGTNGPAYGMHFQSIGVTLTDVLIENETTAGIDAGGEGVSIESSSLVNNGVGANLYGTSSIVESTLAGNSVGLGTSGVLDVNLINDTIAHNTTGVSITASGSHTGVANTIVADNTADCSGYAATVNGDWENGVGASSNNLTDTTQCPPQSGNTTDINYTGSLQSLATSGDPTPYVMPPSEAEGHAVTGFCGATGTDQREYRVGAATSCDIGSVDTSASGTSSVAAGQSPVDFGTVPSNQAAGITTTIFNAGGGLVGVTGVTVTGTGFSLPTNSDGCQYFLLADHQGQYCYVSVAAQPSAADQGATLTGSLTVHLAGASNLVVPLTMVGGAPLTAPGKPTNLSPTAGNGKVTVTWSAPADTGGQPIQDYLVERSTDGGATWSSPDTVYDTVEVISHLSNGTAYEFRVAAYNGFDTGAYSDASAAVTPHGALDDTAITPPKSHSVNFGKSVDLTTTLTDTTTSQQISGATVTLLAKGDSGFTAVTDATTDANGVADVSVKPKATTTYRWSFAGSATHHLAVSNVSNVFVNQVVKAALTKTKVKRHHKVEVYGTVSPSTTGEKITLEIQKGSVWHAIGDPVTIAVQKLPNGKKKAGYDVTYAPKKKGAETLRISSDSTHFTQGGLSKSLTLKVT